MGVTIVGPQPWITRKSRDSKGVVVLYKKELHDIVHVMQKDVDARYMWIQIKRGNLMEL